MHEKLISWNGWGADAPTLRKIYLALTCTKMLYGSCLFASACNTSLKILDRVQYAAARVITGALRCTPTNLLEVQCNLIPLKILRNQHMQMYTSRVLQNPKNPLRKTLLRYVPNEIYDRVGKTSPISVRMVKELNKIGLEVDQIPTIQVEQRLKNYELPVYDSIHIREKNSLTNTCWQALFKDLIETQHDRVHIYTDGASEGEYVGSAVWSEKFTLKPNYL